MRDLIISIACMLVLIVPWSLYDIYSTRTVDNYRDILEKQVIPAVESGDWKTAEESFGFIARDWDDYKKVSAFFIDTQSVNEADSYVSKAYYYIKLQDPANSAAESAFLLYRFNFLHENELPDMGNLF